MFHEALIVKQKNTKTWIIDMGFNNVLQGQKERHRLVELNGQSECP